MYTFTPIQKCFHLNFQVNDYCSFLGKQHNIVQNKTHTYIYVNLDLNPGSEIFYPALPLLSQYKFMVFAHNRTVKAKLFGSFISNSSSPPTEICSLRGVKDVSRDIQIGWGSNPT